MHIPFALLFAGATSMAVHAQSFLPTPGTNVEPTKPLALVPPSAGRRVLNSTGFFVDGLGHILTARHAVETCSRVIVEKDRHRVTARVAARSAQYDLALLKIYKTLGLSAVFPRTVVPHTNDMVFAGAYDMLGLLTAKGGVLANARVAAPPGASEPGHIALDSPAAPGASGSPLLDRNGLVQGVISRRTMVNRVLAVDASEAKSFLFANGIHVEQDDRPQLANSASRANRAASVSARVTCIQN